MKRKVLLLGNPILRERCLPVEDFDSDEFKAEAADLVDALQEFRAEHGFGRGIAAIQIGIKRRMIALNLGRGTFIVANPVIVERSAGTFTLWDDCMSFPDLLVRVARHESIDLEYRDETGALRSWPRLCRAESELLQHEIDHLDGILAVDRAIAPGDLVYRSEFEAAAEFYRAKAEYAIAPTIDRPETDRL